jgi:hypothetical protein
MLMANLYRLSQLTCVERRLLFRSVLFLLIIHFGLSLLGYSRLRGVLERRPPKKPIDQEVSESQIIQHGQAIGRIVSIAAKYGFYEAGCLRRSLLVWWFLRREGIQSEICFGVQMRDRKLVAHAWVEHHGVVLNDSANVYECYRVLQNAFPTTKLGL